MWGESRTQPVVIGHALLVLRHVLLRQIFSSVSLWVSHKPSAHAASAEATRELSREWQHCELVHMHVAAAVQQRTLQTLETTADHPHYMQGGTIHPAIFRPEAQRNKYTVQA